MEQKVLTASANTGIGLWTSICYFFSQIGGGESFNFYSKQKKLISKANVRLEKQLNSLPEGFELSDYRVTWNTPLSVTVSALAIKK